MAVVVAAGLSLAAVVSSPADMGSLARIRSRQRRARRSSGVDPPHHRGRRHRPWQSVLMPWRSTLPKRRLSRQTLVVVRTEQDWRISAIHNVRVRPVTIPAPGTFPSRMSGAMSRVSRCLGMAAPLPAPSDNLARDIPDTATDCSASSPMRYSGSPPANWPSYPGPGCVRHSTAPICAESSSPRRRRVNRTFMGSSASREPDGQQ